MHASRDVRNFVVCVVRHWDSAEIDYSRTGNSQTRVWSLFLRRSFPFDRSRKYQFLAEQYATVLLRYRCCMQYAGIVEEITRAANQGQH